MKRTEIIMGMPITVEIVDAAAEEDLQSVFDYFRSVDVRFSTYKKDSEISQINRGLPRAKWSSDMRRVLELCEATRRQTGGYFDIARGGRIDPSGLVKGWAVQNTAEMLNSAGFRNFYIEAGGDIEARGDRAAGEAWTVGIRNPFDIQETVKAVRVSGRGVATSGTYIRGEHVYNPRQKTQRASAVKSLTVIGPNIYDADRYATAALAMGRQGIAFIEALPGFEGYMIDNTQTATFTRGFEAYVV